MTAVPAAVAYRGVVATDENAGSGAADSPKSEKMT